MADLRVGDFGNRGAQQGGVLGDEIGGEEIGIRRHGTDDP